VRSAGLSLGQPNIRNGIDLWHVRNSKAVLSQNKLHNSPNGMSYASGNVCDFSYRGTCFDTRTKRYILTKFISSFHILRYIKFWNLRDPTQPIVFLRLDD
jgi:hypothetical protein